MVCEDSVCGIDTETEPIKNKYTTPPLVLFAACSGHRVQMCRWEYFDQYQAEFLRLNPTVKFAFFNGPFDQRVMGKDIWIQELNKENRVMELQCAYPAFRISTIGWFSPKFTLESLTSEFFKVKLDKDESVRLDFWRDKPITDRQYVYMVYDGIATFNNGKLLQGQPTESIQARAAFVLSEISMNGMLVDQEYVKQSQEHWMQVMAKESVKLRSFGYPLKRDWSDYKAEDFLYKVASNIGIDNLDVIIGDKTSPPQWWWKFMALQLYTSVLNKKPISEIRAFVRDMLVSLSDLPKDNAEFKRFKAGVDQKLLERMQEIDCTECLVGIGGKPRKPTGSKPWQVLCLIISERIVNGEPSHNYLRDEVHKEIQKEFKELHDQNRGWLSAFKPVSPKKFLQNHVKQLKVQYPALDLELTKASRKNVNAAKVAEAKAAKKEHREQRPVDVSDLIIYQVTGKEAWRFTDQGIDDPFLNSYWRFKHAEKMLSTYVTLKYVEDDGRVHTRFTGFLKTGRTGSSSPLNLMLYYVCTYGVCA